MTPSDRNGDSLDDLDSSRPASTPVRRAASRSADPRRDDQGTEKAGGGPRPRQRQAANGRSRAARSTTRRSSSPAELPLAGDGPDESAATSHDGHDGQHVHEGNGRTTQPIDAVPAEPASGTVTAAPITDRHQEVVHQPITTVVPVVDGYAASTTSESVAPAMVRSGPGTVLWRRRPRVRRVTRVVRHVDPWSVFKIAVVFSAVLYGVCLTAGVLLWEVAESTGTIDNVERFLESGGWETFEFKGGEIYHNMWIGGLFAAAGLVGLAVLVATLFNLITDLVGGIRVTVLEEEVVTQDVARPRRWQALRERLIPATQPAPDPDGQTEPGNTTPLS